MTSPAEKPSSPSAPISDAAPSTLVRVQFPPGATAEQIHEGMQELFAAHPTEPPKAE